MSIAICAMANAKLIAHTWWAFASCSRSEQVGFGYRTTRVEHYFW